MQISIGGELEFKVVNKIFLKSSPSEGVLQLVGKESQIHAI